MSAPVATNFQDHYTVLGIDPKASSELVSQAYNALARKYHPKNVDTGNKEKFDQVNLAFEVLADPAARAAFDTLRFGPKQDGPPEFSGASFFGALQREQTLRQAILCLLYDRRRTKPLTPALSPRQVEAMLHATGDELLMPVWYLKQRGLAQSDDKSNMQITVAGMDALEQQPPDPAVVMALMKAVQG